VPAGTGLTRRGFVARSVGLALSVYGAGKLSAFDAGIASAAAGKPQPILVTVFLQGGADSLSLLYPQGDPLYPKYRKALAMTGGTPFTEDARLFWHPSLAPLSQLHDEGKVSVLPAVGYDHPDQSHFTSRHYWEVGATDARLLTGWLGRYLDAVGTPDNPLQGLSLGGSLQPSLATGRVPVATIDSPPQWRPGDRWTYGWTAGSETGTKTVEVIELREVNRVPFYIVRVGDLTHFYTRELQWTGSMRDQRVESRMTPPLPWFTWPLESGRRWVHQGTYEDANGKTATTDRFSVEGVEAVEVPAGRFQAVKVIRETDRKDLDQYWYAAEVGFYVKWVGRRGDAQFEEHLQEYRRMPPADPSHPTPAPPSTTR